MRCWIPKEWLEEQRLGGGRGNGSRLVVKMMAKQCAWCHRPMTILDQILIYLGVTTTHGMCPACATEWITTEAVS